MEFATLIICLGGTTLFEIFGIFMLIYIQKPGVREKIGTIREHKPNYSSIFPFTTAILFLYLTGGSAVNSSFIEKANIRFFYVLTIFGLTLFYEIVRSWKYIYDMRHHQYNLEKLENQDYKIIVVKAFFYVLLPNLVLFPIGVYFSDKIGYFVFLIYIAIMILLVGIGFQKEFRYWGIQFKDLLLISGIIVLDTIVSLTSLFILEKHITNNALIAVYIVFLIIRIAYSAIFLFRRPKEKHI